MRVGDAVAAENDRVFICEVAKAIVESHSVRRITSVLLLPQDQNATDRQPVFSAASAIASGEARSCIRSKLRAFEMSQFWQNLQVRLQPAVPKDRTGVPGKKWLSGFFSIGSMQNPD